MALAGRSASWFIGIACVATLIGSLSSPYHLNLVTTIGIYTIGAIGMSLIFGQIRQLNMGQAAFFGIGGYTAGFLAVKLSLNAVIGILASALVPALIALPIGWAVLRLSGFYLALATLALNSIVIALLSQYEGGPAGVTGIPGIPPISIGGISFEGRNAYAALVWCIALVLLAFSDNLLRSRIGRALRSIRASEPAALVTGISVVRYKLAIFVFGCSLAGLAGALSAYYNGFIGPDSASIAQSVFFLVAVVVGGRGSIWGAPLGVTALVLLVEAVSKYGQYEVLAYGVLLSLALMFMPEGIVGVVARCYDSTLRLVLSKEKVPKGEVDRPI